MHKPPPLSFFVCQPKIGKPKDMKDHHPPLFLVYFMIFAAIFLVLSVTLLFTNEPETSITTDTIEVPAIPDPAPPE